MAERAVRISMEPKVGPQAKQAFGKLKKEMKSVGREKKKALAFGPAMKQSFGKMRAGLRSIGRQAKKALAFGPAMKQSFGKMRAGLRSIGRQAKKALNFAKYIGIGAAVGLIGMGVSAKDFGKAMAEVSTIVDTSTVNMSAMNDELLVLSKTTGKAPEELAKGLYQTISAGVEAGQAMDFLAISTRAAIAGVAETSDAVRLSSGIINAYALDVSEATRIQDIAFKTVQHGVTTYDELAQHMGKVIPFAAQLEISLEDLFASVATLTKGSIETAKATTALRGVMAAVISPSTEAAEVADDLKIAFSAAAIKTKGFAGFLEDVRIKTKGDTEALAKLFPNVRGLTAILALAGKQAGEFAEIQGELKKSTGAMGTAFDEVTKSEAFKYEQAMNRLKIIGIKIGTIVLPDMTKGLEALAGNLETWDSDGSFIEWWQKLHLAALNFQWVVLGINTGLAKLIHIGYKATKMMIQLQRYQPTYLPGRLLGSDPLGKVLKTIEKEETERPYRDWRLSAEKQFTDLKKRRTEIESKIAMGQIEREELRKENIQARTFFRREARQQGIADAEEISKYVKAEFKAWRDGLKEEMRRNTQQKLVTATGGLP